MIGSVGECKRKPCGSDLCRLGTVFIYLDPVFLADHNLSALVAYSIDVNSGAEFGSLDRAVARHFLLKNTLSVGRIEDKVAGSFGRVDEFSVFVTYQSIVNCVY